jgi:trehalose-6-phosphatase
MQDDKNGSRKIRRELCDQFSENLDTAGGCANNNNVSRKMRITEDVHNDFSYYKSRLPGLAIG